MNAQNNIDINSASTTTGSWGLSSGTWTYTPVATPALDSLSITDISNHINGVGYTPGNIIISTTGNIDITNDFSITNSSGAAKNITFTSAAITASNSITIAGTNPSLTSLYFNQTSSSSISQAISTTRDINITNSGSLTLSGVLVAVNFNKSGTGILTLSGANTYTGATTINAGILKLGLINAIPTGSAITLNAQLDVNGFSPTFLSLAGTTTSAKLTNSLSATNVTVTINGTTSTIYQGIIENGLGNSLSLTKLGTGVLTLSGASTYTGATSISNGAINITTANALGSTSVITVNSGELQLQGTGITYNTYPLTINGLGISTTTGSLHNLSGNNTWPGTITLGTASRINSDAGTLSISAISGTNNLTLGGAGNITVSGIISTNTGTLTKDGNGTLTLSGANTYTGATAISAGVVNIQNATALGTIGGATTVSNGAALQIQGGISVAEPMTITGTGGGNGAIRSISGSNTISGLVTLTGASQIQSDAATADTLKFTGSNAITGANTALTIAGAGNITISGTITTGTTTAATLAKSGTGILTLSGANTYAGATTISAGLVNIQNATALGTIAGATIVANAAALEIQGGITVAEAITISGTGLANNGVLRNVSGKNTISGTITIGASSQIQSDADTLKLTASNSINATANGYNLTFDGVGHFVISGTITTRTGGLLKTGAGSISLGAVNTYTGETNLTSGVLYLGINNPISNSSIFTFNGGKLITNGKNLTVGAINVYDNSTIELLNAKHTISFSSLGVVDLRSLTITGWQGNAYSNPNASSGASGSIIIGSTLTFKELDQIQFLNPSDGLYYNAGQISPSNEVTPINSKLAFANIRIATATTTTLSGVAPISEGGTWSGLVTGVYTFTPNANNATILDLEISNRMNGIGGYSPGNVVINTACALCSQSGSIYFDDVLNSNSVSTTGTMKTLTLNANKNISVDFTISLNRSASVAFANSLTFNAGGDIQTNASITATTSGNNSFAGTINITAVGNVNITQPVTVTNSSSSGTGGNINISGNTVTIAGALGTNATNGASGTGGSINITGNTVSISGAIDTKAAGTTSGTGGNINIIATNGINLTSSTITANGLTNDGTLTLNTNASSITTAGVNNGQTSGIISGGTNIVKSGTGQFFFNGANTNTGSTTITDGILKIGSATAISATSPVVVNAQLDLNGFSPTFVSLAGTNNTAKVTNSSNTPVTLNINGVLATNNTSYVGILENNGSGALSINKLGTSVLTLSGSNTYTGATTIRAGAISIEHENALGAVAGGTTVLAGAELQMAGGGKRFASEPLNLRGNGISGTGAALHNVTGKNTWVGAIILDSTTSIFSDLNDTLTIANIDSVTGTNKNLIFGGAGVIFDSASIKTGTGTLLKTGTGTVNLNVQNTFTGATTISAGILKLGVANSISVSTSLANNLTTIDGQLDLNGFSLTIDSLKGANTGIITSNAGTLTLLRGNYSGAIQNALSLVKSGSANNLLTLSGSSTYTGATSLNAGVINIQNGSALGTNAGTTTIASGAALQVQGNISSPEPIFAAGAGIANDGVIRNISGVNTLTGLVTLTNALQLQSDGSTTDTLKLTGLNAITGANFGITFNGTGNILVGGTITGSGNITKIGTGTTVLAGANTFTGAVNINQGVINIQNPAALGDTALGTTTIESGAELQIKGAGLFKGEKLFINGSGKSSTGAFNVVSGNITYPGLVTLNSASTIASAGTLNLTAKPAAITGSYGLTFGGTGGIILTGIISIGNNTVTKNDAGAVNLNAVNTYTGLTTIYNGTLRMGGVPAIPVTNDINIVAGTLDLYGQSNTIASLNGAGIVTNSVVGVASTLTISGTSTNSSYSGTIIDGAGVVSIAKEGTSILTLSGANTYTGNTTLSAGALKLGDNNVLPNTSSLVFDGGTFYNMGFSDIVGVLSITNKSSIYLDTTFNSSLSFTNIGAIGVNGSKLLTVYGYMGASATTALDKYGSLLASINNFIRTTGALGSTVIGGLTANGKIITSTASNPNNILNGIYINTPNISNSSLSQIRYWVGDSQPTPVFGLHNVTQSSYNILPML